VTTSSDDYWDELGVTWCAIDPDIRVIKPRLEARLRRQTEWITAALVIGVPLGVAGVLLGVVTICLGFVGPWNFVTRGVAMVAISVVLTLAVCSLQPVRAVDTTSALSDMIELAIGRAQRTLSLIRAGLYSCVIAAVFGLVGSAIRAHLGIPPKMSPVVALAIVALSALVLSLYRQQIRAGLAKYGILKRALVVNGDGHA
jgi:hypothetical protein